MKIIEENAKGELDSFDPRLIQTVRSLKSKPFRHSEEAVTKGNSEKNTQIS